MKQYLDVADIRNKLTPLSNLIALLKEYNNTNDEKRKANIFSYIQKQLDQCDKSIEYLSQQ
jgi:hypothetical protein